MVRVEHEELYEGKLMSWLNGRLDPDLYHVKPTMFTKDGDMKVGRECGVVVFFKPLGLAVGCDGQDTLVKNKWEAVRLMTVLIQAVGQDIDQYLVPFRMVKIKSSYSITPESLLRMYDLEERMDRPGSETYPSAAYVARALRLKKFHDNYLTPKNCGVCSRSPGEMHVVGCSVERCQCGSQSIACGCDDTFYEKGRDRNRWSGLYPGTHQCVKLGYFSRNTLKDGTPLANYPTDAQVEQGVVYHVPCNIDDVGAGTDMNRWCSESVTSRSRMLTFTDFNEDGRHVNVSLYCGEIMWIVETPGFQSEPQRGSVLTVVLQMVLDSMEGMNWSPARIQRFIDSLPELF